MGRFATLVIDRNCLFREGLKLILSKTRFRPTATGKQFSDLKPLAARTAQDVLVIIGPSFANSSLAHEVELIKETYLHPRILVLADQHASDELTLAFSAGVSGFLATNIPPELLIRSLDLILSGEVVISTRIFSTLMSTRSHARDSVADIIHTEGPILLSSGESVVDATVDAEVFSAAPGPRGSPPPAPKDFVAPALSERETAILACLTRGETNKVIARRFSVAEATVKVHVKSILRKIRVKNRTQAAIWAVDHVIQPVPGASVRVANGAESGVYTSGPHF